MAVLTGTLAARIWICMLYLFQLHSQTSTLCLHSFFFPALQGFETSPL